MRSRYSAFFLHRAEYLLATGPHADRAALEAGFAGTTWLGLTLEKTEAGGPGDAEGYVTFAARFLEGGRCALLRERSRFEKTDGRWRYVSGDARVEPVSLGRNDVCPCGSGKKARRCHL